MSEDKRSMRMVAAINCVINHNARVEGAACYPGINMRIVSILDKHDCGIIQMPCPEMDFLGHARTGTTEDQGVLDALDTEDGRAHCARLAAKVVDDIADFQANGYTVAAILGGNVDSPGCAVPHPGEHETGTWGVFLGALRDELKKRDIPIPIRGMRDDVEETFTQDLQWLDQALGEK